MDNNLDLTICQDCKVNPATYGDGVTWSRCSACQRKTTEGLEPETKLLNPNGPMAPDQSFEHEIKEGLVSIILPVYINSYALFHYTGNCIGSIREHTKEGDYELVVVDNGSPIKPPNLQSFYAHRIVQNEENLGVTKAWNQGIRVCIGEYIVLLNNDVQVFDGWLEDMKAALNSGLDLVMAHPMYSNTEPFARAVEARLAREGKKKFDDIPGSKDFSCVMFKRSLLDELGLFDETFFSYCSDSDLFRRMDRAGKKYAVVNVFTSHISDATGFSIPETPEIMNKDKAAFEEKWNKIELEEKHPGFEAIPGPKVELPKEDPRFFRTAETGDRVFFIDLKTLKAHWVKNPETLAALGGHLGTERTISREEYQKFEKGEAIDMNNVENFKDA